MTVSIGMIDTMIVSSEDKTAISGVALVDSVNYLIILVFGALATGGAVVISQFIEKRIWKTVNLRQTPVWVVFVASVVLTFVSVFSKRDLLTEG